MKNNGKTPAIAVAVILVLCVAGITLILFQPEGKQSMTYAQATSSRSPLHCVMVTGNGVQTNLGEPVDTALTVSLGDGGRVNWTIKPGYKLNSIWQDEHKVSPSEPLILRMSNVITICASS